MLNERHYRTIISLLQRPFLTNSSLFSTSFFAANPYYYYYCPSKKSNLKEKLTKLKIEKQMPDFQDLEYIS